MWGNLLLSQTATIWRKELTGTCGFLLFIGWSISSQGRTTCQVFLHWEGAKSHKGRELSIQSHKGRVLSVLYVQNKNKRYYSSKNFARLSFGSSFIRYTLSILMIMLQWSTSSSHWKSLWSAAVAKQDPCEDITWRQAVTAQEEWMGVLYLGRSFLYFFLVKTQQCGEQLEILAGVGPFPSTVSIAADKNVNKHDKLKIRLTLNRLLMLYMVLTLLSSIQEGHCCSSK